ncbi:LysR family transcriptional regulator [Donghicola mangrovi]|uniref:LysR family transcriptional regulator n=1 Tax=Donghicola mangrovi TaxID=2729614 RepID=A0A850Q9Q5_9RHOB|nr:LysR family transcriptional regulator [Donghicola mangrovi]NVO25634.1 LysR family transcriptional regulator [Donghicola mangrovi]
MDKLRAMAVFVTVARCESLSAAAREMDVPLTNISRLLSQLEDSLGCALITRSSRRLELTPEGREYLTACRLILDDLEQAESRLSGGIADLSGPLTITAPETFGKLHVLPVLTDFLKQHPAIDARLLLLDRRVDMIEEGVDVAVRIGALRDSGHLATLVGSQRMVTCAAPDYLAGAPALSRVSQLAAHSCICFVAQPSGLRWTYASRRGGRKTIRVRPRLTVNSAEAAVDAAISGLGVIRVLAYQARHAIRSGQLVPLLEEWDDTEIPVHLLRWPHRTAPRRVKDFISFAAERLREPLGEMAPPALVGSADGACR